MSNDKENKSKLKTYIKECEKLVKTFKFIKFDDIDSQALDSYISKYLETSHLSLFRAKIHTNYISTNPLHIETYVLVQENHMEDPMTFMITRKDKFRKDDSTQGIMDK